MPRIVLELVFQKVDTLFEMNMDMVEIVVKESSRDTSRHKCQHERQHKLFISYGGNGEAQRRKKMCENPLGRIWFVAKSLALLRRYVPVHSNRITVRLMVMRAMPPKTAAAPISA